MDAEQYEHNDDDMDYNEGVKASIDSMADYVAYGILRSWRAGSNSRKCGRSICRRCQRDSESYFLNDREEDNREE